MNKINRLFIELKKLLLVVAIFSFGWCAGGYFHTLAMFKVNPIAIEELE